jgi:hypothetical protein
MIFEYKNRQVEIYVFDSLDNGYIHADHATWIDTEEELSNKELQDFNKEEHGIITERYMDRDCMLPEY